MNCYFYSRISTVNQSEERQTENFKKHSYYDPKKVYVDKVQGNVKFLERKQASELFDVLTSTDELNTVVIDSIDRLGRDLIDIISTIDLFTKNRINVESLKEGFNTLLPTGEENPTAKLIIGVLGSVAEMERNRIKERTREGIEIAKAKGKYTGRKVGSTESTAKLLEKHSIVAKKLKKGLSVREIVEITGKSSATVIKVKKALEL